MKKRTLWGMFFAVTVVATAGCSHQGMGPHGRADMDYAAERGTKEMSVLVEKTVQDQEKSTKVQALIGEIVEEVKQSRQQGRQFHRQLYDLNANYDATPEDFTKILDELNNNRMRTAIKILGLRFKIKELLTVQEWKALSDGMNSYRNRYWQGTDTSEGKRG